MNTQMNTPMKINEPKFLNVKEYCKKYNLPLRRIYKRITSDLVAPDCIKITTSVYNEYLLKDDPFIFIAKRKKLKN